MMEVHFLHPFTRPLIKMSDYRPVAVAVPVLPIDLIMEILSWLPVKHLVRFTCVSKLWKSLIISNPTFTKLHLQRSPRNTHILPTIHVAESDYTDFWAVLPISVRRLLHHSPLTVNIDDVGWCRFSTDCGVCGSSNGLVCLRNYRYHGKIGHESWYIRLWNPALRLKSEESPSIFFNIRNEPLKTARVNFGFGYDDSTDTYKVVAVFWNGTIQKMDGMVHCMGDKCWRKILGCPAFPILLEQTEGQLVNGTVNWLALNIMLNNSGRYQWKNATIEQLVIFSLDLGKEAGRYMLLPEAIGEVPCVEPKLTILRGFLCLYHDDMTTHMFMWQMSEFGVEDSWIPLVNLSYQRIQCNNLMSSAFDYPLLPLWLSDNGDILLLAHSESLKLIIYNRRDDTVEFARLPSDRMWMNNVNDYVQSLVLPRFQFD